MGSYCARPSRPKVPVLPSCETFLQSAFRIEETLDQNRVNPWDGKGSSTWDPGYAILCATSLSPTVQTRIGRLSRQYPAQRRCRQETCAKCLPCRLQAGGQPIPRGVCIPIRMHAEAATGETERPPPWDEPPNIHHEETPARSVRPSAFLHRQRLLPPTTVPSRLVVAR